MGGAITKSHFYTSHLHILHMPIAVIELAFIFGTLILFAGCGLGIIAPYALGLSLAHWYDFMHAGFLSKALAYPSALFTVGLLFLGLGDKRTWTIISSLSAVAGSAPSLENCNRVFRRSRRTLLPEPAWLTNL